MVTIVTIGLHFLFLVQADKDGYSEIVTRVIDQEISSLNTNVGVDTYQYNKDYLELNSRSHRARVEGMIMTKQFIISSLCCMVLKEVTYDPPPPPTTQQISLSC